MNDQLSLDDLAAWRESAHTGEGHHCHPDDPTLPHRLGVIGEACFARAFGLNIDVEQRPNGDGGVDFLLPCGLRSLRVDVKTTVDQRAFCLLVEANKVRRADVFVLCWLYRSPRNGPLQPRLLGWETCSVVSCFPIQEFGHGKANHFLLPSDLRPMGDLMRLCALPPP